MVRLVRIHLGRLCVLALLTASGGMEPLLADESFDEPDPFPGRTIAPCDVIERSATAKDTPLTTRIPVLVSEPENWRNLPGPHGERAVSWQETSKYHGYQVLDRQGRLLHKLASVSMPRWSPDGRWLAVSRWSRELPYQLALVEVRTGRVIPIPGVEYLDHCVWSPDSRRLAFVARTYPSGDSSSVGWIAVPDTSTHAVARDLNHAFECFEMAWSADSRRFVALMHREYEHDDVRVTDLWLFGLTAGACRLTATPRVEESSVSWLDDRHVIFQTNLEDDATQSGFGTVLELPALEKSPR